LRPGGRMSARDVAAPFAEIFMRGISSTQGATRRRRRPPMAESVQGAE
jgi:hypothetical protein